MYICWRRVGFVVLCWWAGAAFCTGAYGEVTTEHWKVFWEVTGVLWTIAGSVTALVSTLVTLYDAPFYWMCKK